MLTKESRPVLSADIDVIGEKLGLSETGIGSRRDYIYSASRTFEGCPWSHARSKTSLHLGNQDTYFPLSSLQIFLAG